MRMCQGADWTKSYRISGEQGHSVLKHTKIDMVSRVPMSSLITGCSKCSLTSGFTRSHIQTCRPVMVLQLFIQGNQQNSVLFNTEQPLWLRPSLYTFQIFLSERKHRTSWRQTVQHISGGSAVRCESWNPVQLLIQLSITNLFLSAIKTFLPS